MINNIKKLFIFVLLEEQQTHIDHHQVQLEIHILNS